jgi:hypothetical protein
MAIALKEKWDHLATAGAEISEQEDDDEDEEVVPSDKYQKYK